MTDDVKEPVAAEAPASTETTPQGSEPTPQSQPKAEAQPQAQTSQEEERQVPLSVLLEERRKAREKIRAIQRSQSNRGQNAEPAPHQGNQPGYDPRYVAELQTKVAVSELQDFARKKVKDYPDLPSYLKRAIINNPRGFIKGTTQDVETGKLDIEDYLEDEQARYEDEQAKQAPAVPKKTVHVAGNNKPDNIQSGTTPADIQAIFDKPLDEWTKTDRERLKEYRESHT